MIARKKAERKDKRRVDAAVQRSVSAEKWEAGRREWERLKAEQDHKYEVQQAQVQYWY